MYFFIFTDTLPFSGLDLQVKPILPLFCSLFYFYRDLAYFIYEIKEFACIIPIISIPFAYSLKKCTFKNPE